MDKWIRKFNGLNRTEKRKEKIKVSKDLSSKVDSFIKKAINNPNSIEGLSQEQQHTKVLNHFGIKKEQKKINE